MTKITAFQYGLFKYQKYQQIGTLQKPEAAMNVITSPQISFRQVLIATDLSDASSNALQYAKAIAKQYASHLVLVHVCQPVAHIPIPQGGWIEDGATQRIEEEKTYALGTELRAEGYVADAVTTYGQIEHEVLSLAEARGADLIVLGTHGPRGMDRLLSGSEAEALIYRCDRPVLTVGPAVVPPLGNTRLLDRIVCAAAPGTYSAKAAAYGYRLAQENRASFILIYAENPDGAPSPDGWQAFEDAFAKELPGGQAQHCAIQGYFSNESPAADIVEVAKKRQAGLIVLGAKPAIPGSTHFRRGVVPEVLLRAPCPVLTIRSH
ncbi:MAG: universal stress protein [Acidobacteriaceae bacterium]